MTTMTSEEIRIGELAIRFLVESEDSGGSVAVFQFDVPARAKVPVAHSHDAYEETIYGLEGVLTWTIDGERQEIGAGEVLCIRRGVVHKFENESDVDAKALAMVSPGVLGPQYFRDVAAVVETSAGGPPDPAAIGAVMQRHGLTPAPDHSRNPRPVTIATTVTGPAQVVIRSEELRDEARISGVASFLHTMVRVTDPKKSRTFYEALGFRFTRDLDIVRDGELEATNYFYSIGDAENVLELTYNHDGRKYELGTAYGHVAIGVDDLDATLEQLKGQGIEPEREPYRVREGGSRLCFVRDPDGYRIELIDRSS
jgi:lactoylglutathione lyase